MYFNLNDESRICALPFLIKMCNKFFHSWNIVSIWKNCELFWTDNWRIAFPSALILGLKENKYMCRGPYCSFCCKWISSALDLCIYVIFSVKNVLILVEVWVLIAQSLYVKSVNITGWVDEKKLKFCIFCSCFFLLFV